MPAITPAAQVFGGMDELAAAAAVVAMSIDDNAADDMELDDDTGDVARPDGSTSLLEATDAGKENGSNLPAV